MTEAQTIFPRAELSHSHLCYYREKLSKANSAITEARRVAGLMTTHSDSYTIGSKFTDSQLALQQAIRELTLASEEMDRLHNMSKDSELLKLR